MEFHCGVPCMQDALIATVLDLDRACRADLGARPAAYAGVGMDAERSADSPFRPAPDKRNSCCTNHVTADTHA